MHFHLKTLLAALLLAFLPFVEVSAQEARVPQFGYLSFKEVLHQMPDYKKAQEDFAALKARYDAETARSEEEFQLKFAEVVKISETSNP